jgi:benzoyl-CoA reductase/2-hydroxyglutaryl-CoA dehydratase subunit BcrC/BadD/HgdB
MVKRIAGDGWLTSDPLRVLANKRLIRSRPVLRTSRAMAPRRGTYRPYERVSLDFTLELAERLFADGSRPVVWVNLFFPSELVWGLGTVPFYPEMGASIGAGLGLSPTGLEQSEALGYSVDLCTFNRSAAGLRAADFYPRADAYVSTSNLCDVTGQLLANFACEEGRSFVLLDVPQSRDESALDYLTAQLQDLIERWTTELRIPFDPERMRQAVRLSNQARALALEAAALREADPAPLRGSTMLGQLGILTSIFGHPSGVAYYQALRDYTWERVQRAGPEQANQKVRLYWMHLRPYFLTDFLVHLEDNLSVVIAFEEASTVWWDALDEEEPVRSLARKVLSNPLNGPVERRVDITLQHIARYRCRGAIHFSHWGCRQSSGALHIVRTRLRKEGVPLLVLDGDCVDPANLQMGPLRTRAEAFIEMLV